MRPKAYGLSLFQHTAARRRLASTFSYTGWSLSFQHTAARRRLDGIYHAFLVIPSFNTQPPEGGW